MNVVYMLLFIITAACFVGAAFRVGTTKVSLLALGLFFWVLVPLIQTVRQLN